MIQKSAQRFFGKHRAQSRN